MKKKILTLLLVAISAISCNDGIWSAIHDLEDKYTDLDGRVAKLEELCKEMNTNISSLKTLVNVILNNDYIISTTPITKDGKEIGYVITFAIHEPITIYHGQNGKDGADGKNGQDGKDGKDGKNGENGTNGQNGKDGADGITPIIGVAQDETDHAYYWTLNGEWLLDANGNRIPLSSRDGINGQDGQDGKDGKDGKNGQDGITPQLKIEAGYWYISYDNGTTWTQLGKATGENGQNGQDGQDGEKGDKGDPGDTMFSSVTQDDYYVYFTLSNGTVIKIPVASEDYGTDPENRVEVVNGVIMTGFSIAADRQVYFTNGNLQYQPSTGGWRFAKRQYDYLGLSNSDITDTYNGWIDKFQLSDVSERTYMNDCRILTVSEWNFLINRHSLTNYKYALARVNNVVGIILLPDIFIQPRGVAQLQTAPPSVTDDGVEKLSNYYYTANIVSAADWREYENAGAVFLPINSARSTSDSKGSGSYLASNGYFNFAISNSPYTQYKPKANTSTETIIQSVRLVKDIE